MNNNDGHELREILARLKQEHRTLDDTIKTLELGPAVDQLRISRLKKKKLQLKDEIARIEDQIFPDIIA